MAGEGAGREMNGAARCGRQRCQVLARSGCKGWGPERQGLPGSSVSPSGTRAGAWGREPPAPHGAGFSALPLPGPAPPRWAVQPREVRGRGAVVAEPRRPAPLRLCALPVRGFGDRGGRARGPAWPGSEKREALLVGFARSP